MTWFQELQPAKFAGIPFGVTGGQVRVGRRNAVHEYPNKDEVWVEDLGRSARRITLVGFLVEGARYGGAISAIQQREQMIAVLEAPGKNTLVHPTLGSLQVATLDASFTERKDLGRVFELSLSFIESGERVFPSASQDTTSLVAQACTAADAAAGADFLALASTSLPSGEAVVTLASQTASSWGSKALSLASDATNLMNLAGSLPGSFGRFLGANLKGITGLIPGGVASAFSTVSSLIAAGAAAREAVSTAFGSLMSAAGGLSVGTCGIFSGAAQALASALLGATTDPGDSIRVLASLSNFHLNQATPSSNVGTSMATMQDACGNLFRRAAVVCVARSAAKYQPASYDDAVAIRTKVTDLLEAEIAIAGDSGEDATYTALRAVRAAVVQDMNARGANLTALITVVSPRPVPSLVLAQRLYRDASRADELVTEASPVHPCFMPVSFKALAR